MKTKKLFFAALVSLCSFNFANAQLQVESDGEVRIGVPNGANAHLCVTTNTENRGLYINSNRNTSGTKYGIENRVFDAGTGMKYGLYNYVKQNTSSSQKTYGIYNTTIANGTGVGYGQYNLMNTSGANVKYGIYNKIDNSGSGDVYGLRTYITSAEKGYGSRTSYYANSSSNLNYGSYIYTSNSGTGGVTGLYVFTPQSDGEAGLFNGDVTVLGSFTQASDAATKQDIEVIENALDVVQKLQPKAYNYKEIENVNLPKGTQYGFIAQELEEVLPTLVKEVTLVGLTPEETETTTEKTEEQTFKTVNYTGVTPILVKALQEQQALIEKLEQKVEALEQKLNK